MGARVHERRVYTRIRVCAIAAYGFVFRESTIDGHSKAHCQKSIAADGAVERSEHDCGGSSAFRRTARDLLLDECTSYPTAPAVPSIGAKERLQPLAIAPEDRDIATVVEMMRGLTMEGKGRVIAYTQGIVDTGQFRRKANGVR